MASFAYVSFLGLGMEIVVIMNINFSKFADYEEFLTMVLQTKM
jgi:hypothetical protein